MSQAPGNRASNIGSWPRFHGGQKRHATLKQSLSADCSSQNLVPCDTCGRHFVQDALLRHQPICRKVFNKKRKPFNSLKQRLQGTEILTVKRKPPPKNQEKKSNWRQQHENFITAIRAAKLASIAMKEGRPLPPPPPPTINPDYIQCPYCMRRFNEAAAERHINFCKEQAARRAFAPGQKGAKQAPGKQAASKKEPTLTCAVGTLLQNRPQEGTSPRQPETGYAVEPSAGPAQKKVPIPYGKEPG
ncbi:zinc finger C2HC domain-containing protein 1B [Eublepharis macularius]|uniref:Zinc finger C2HC domain-containing protein 1B n=1 Tax=Eublepharis macularius TaxID=481883 RepID=A0AA97KS63_EUBMA|nr:zinc finger C2HC domain-containing protein 1B [Eublepharis macularius]